MIEFETFPWFIMDRVDKDSSVAQGTSSNRLFTCRAVSSSQRDESYVSLHRSCSLLPDIVASSSSDSPIYSFADFLLRHSLAETSRKAIKSKNNSGSPVRLQSKILAIIADPLDDQAVYVAESAGTARRILLDDVQAPIPFSLIQC